ncbi:(2Fe-2S)-binding protein [Gordonia desulfuricans]|uniref:(2Fe-2S)-binding protein n=1 Tax=Gordonia desulfuricans TaxID=89051 RepID=A0A7K3LJ11_9ACTN|nr:(2Fe-2S)-binding protein [Gordonia desulfuricans]NDK88163.1 (2Fe-2S)-binding protein [Gordonia desulfuricans]
MSIDIGPEVNGHNVVERIDPRMTLADFLRQRCGLASVRTGCEQGACGSCTVELDGVTARSCLTLAATADGSTITTVEGIAPTGELTALQYQLWRHHGLQCGFCTSGIIMVMREFLRENPEPTEQQVREALSGNICRCTGYQNIVDAVLDAARVERDRR